MVAFEIYENALKPRELSAVDAYLFADFQIWPRLRLNARADRQLNCRDFSFVDRQALTSVTYNLQHSGSDHDRTPLVIVKFAKQVSREKWLFELFFAVRPLPNALVFWQEAFKSK